MRLSLTAGLVLLFCGIAALPTYASDIPKAAAQSSSAALPKIKLVEPRLHLAKGGAGAKSRVALTFDACMGAVDERILSTLIKERIPSTIFVTARWLRKNPQTVATFIANPDLFEIENHGENHIPAIDVAMPVYGIPSAGSPEAVSREVGKGAEAVIAAGFSAPRWFRGATAKYDASSIDEIRKMGYRVAGYSLNGDDGSLLGAGAAEKRIAGAKDGDVVISHINQPTHAAGQGVANAILKLKARGVEFVRLADVETVGDNDTTAQRPGLF
ncbi:polysaccharide deacetylase [Rhizobium wenxiniae]|uniref:Chitooligosaccharide deacetylase n=1 Tax=Rhizobium wenxiniae TaxID=1737357 RepID=A0A7W9Y6C7_9HYPH|nr:polysaccharide deacetylase family protein [Rhizobium wenxiniae]MBB6162825.1 peptidoglycan/xylan/chitin deacetylase (PgdA/CDA1 family) [Rhizobium wenxiniae]GGF95580.1 polysaccharide deacetylase [Rhizobium wenxiniae]